MNDDSCLDCSDIPCSTCGYPRGDCHCTPEQVAEQNNSGLVCESNNSGGIFTYQTEQGVIIVPRLAKIFKIIDLVLADNSLTYSDIKEQLNSLDSQQIKWFVEQAENIPDDKIESFAIGESTESNKIAYEYKAVGLSNWLDTFV